MAMIAQRLGFSTLLVERGRHPRFAIGESSTPLANRLLEELARDYKLPFLKPLCKWGTWQQQTPQLACGIKRGFTFYHHEFGKPFAPDPDGNRQLLVGASPNEVVADTHWYRPDFDHYLVKKAQDMGVIYLDQLELGSANEGSNCFRLEGKHLGQPIKIEGELVLDATGPRGFLFRALELQERQFSTLPPTQALFSHFMGVGPLPDSFSSNGRLPPYPPEQAAVHHIFPGGWVWVLKFNNGLTSAGVAATEQLADKLNLHTGEAGWKNLLRELPSLAEIFQSAKAVVPFIHQRRVSFQSSVVTGQRWAMLPSAAGVVDPLLSTGFPLTLLGIERLAGILQRHGTGLSSSNELQEYGRLTTRELETTAQLVAALYSTMDRFSLFRELSLLYFAAASFSETARRLNKPALADSFLLCKHSVFGPELIACGRRAAKAGTEAEAADLQNAIRAVIQPFEVAGLTDRTRHPWYPALVSDLYAAAPKLGVSEADIRMMLKECGLEKGCT